MAGPCCVLLSDGKKIMYRPKVLGSLDLVEVKKKARAKAKKQPTDIKGLSLLEIKKAGRERGKKSGKKD